jgi:hypothetical protein
VKTGRAALAEQGQSHPLTALNARLA